MSRKRIYIAGHNGMVGSALVRNLETRNDVELILKTRQELNLLDQQAVNNFFKTEDIDEVY
ncbi:TPA: NAD-dependent epimerase/dehydratase family protein, partial [Escherichia coli]